MTAMTMNMRELSHDEVDEVSGAGGPVGAAVGGVIGGIAGAGAAMASGGSMGGIIGGAVGGALVGGAVGFFNPAASAVVARTALQAGQAGIISGMIARGVEMATKN